MKHIYPISIVLLVFASSLANSSSVYEGSWQALSFDTGGGYTVAISIGEDDFIASFAVAFENVEIAIPADAYSEIKAPNLQEVRFLQSGRGYATLVIPTWYYEERSDYSNQIQTFYFQFKTGTFTKVTSEPTFTVPWASEP